jgi:hypothetical protein
VLKLYELHEPLHVGERAASELQVARGIRALREALVLDASLDALDFADVALGDLRRVPNRVGELHEVADERRIACHPAGTEQCLGLPRERPPGVVRAVRVERPSHDPVAALGAQVGIEFERESGVFTEANEIGNDAQCTSLCRLRHGAGAGIGRGIRRAEDVDDVGIGADAQLATAEPSHADDRELRPVGLAPPDRLHERRDVTLGHVGEAASEFLDGAHVEDRGEGQAQDLATTDGAEHLGRGIRITVPAEHGALLVFERGEGPRPQLVDVFEPRNRLGDPLEELAGEARAREHAREPQGRIRRVPKQTEIPVRRAECVAQPPE